MLSFFVNCSKCRCCKSEYQFVRETAGVDEIQHDGSEREPYARTSWNGIGRASFYDRLRIQVFLERKNQHYRQRRSLYVSQHFSNLHIRGSSISFLGKAYINLSTRDSSIVSISPCQGWSARCHDDGLLAILVSQVEHDMTFLYRNGGLLLTISSFLFAADF